MARRPRNDHLTSRVVEARESFAASLPGEPMELIVRQGTTWKRDHPVVAAHGELFVDLGDGQTTTRYMPPGMAA
jgi:hypothetical protein